MSPNIFSKNSVKAVNIIALSLIVVGQLFHFLMKQQWGIPLSVGALSLVMLFNVFQSRRFYHRSISGIWWLGLLLPLVFFLISMLIALLLS
jgi:hypothetical protein